MPNDNVRQEAIALYDRFTHEGMDRRLFMRRMVALAGSVAAAEALIGAIAASPAAAAVVPEDDDRLRSVMLQAEDGFAGYAAYVSQPRSRSLKPTVLVIHENRGLNEHIRDVARRLALAGFRAVAPDFLSRGLGGTPANEDAARDMIGKLDLSKTVADATLMLKLLAAGSRGGKVGAVGFCWGGGFVHRLAIAAGDKLDAGVVYYGPAPDPSEAPKVQAPLMIHHAGLDTRVAQTLWPWVTALRAAGKPVTYFNYEGANHAFNNDTSAERYNKAAADLAWKRTLRFFRKHLG
jgi:carboxymethylenebutenolidase